MEELLIALTFFASYSVGAIAVGSILWLLIPEAEDVGIGLLAFFWPVTGACLLFFGFLKVLGWASRWSIENLLGHIR